MSWTNGSDDWPMPKMIDLWADRLANGDLLALGIHWVPDPTKRREVTPGDVPDDAYQIAISKDRGQHWTIARATIDCPPDLGSEAARPLRILATPLRLAPLHPDAVDHGRAHLLGILPAILYADKGMTKH